MNPILEELYWNHILSPESHPSPGPAFVKLAEKKSAVLDQLMENLSSQEKELFDQYCSLNSDMEHFFQYRAYKRSLQFGIGMMIELFYNADENASSFST